MPFNRARYVTVCQQLLVTAVVSAVGLTAAGVMTLDIVAPDAAPDPGLAGDLTPAVRVTSAYVDSKPVNPIVRDVSLGTTTPALGVPIGRSARRSTPPRGSEGATRAAAPNGAANRIGALPIVSVSPPEKVGGYATVGVTWSSSVHLAENQIAVQVRTENHGTWSAWQKVQYHDDHGPDATTAESAHQRAGTDPMLVGTVERVQVRVATDTGAGPAGMQLALINPGQDTLTKAQPAIDTAKLPASDASATGAPIESTAALATPTGDGSVATHSSSTVTSGGIALSAMKLAPKPQIFSRAQWGANEKLREQGPPLYGTVKTGFVHHTVNANDYSEADVPALIRGIYAYHVISRGWRDIGYNFLVDRFGRIWEGRYGGVDRPVVGAQALGYNDVSFGASAIGNYDIAQPPQAVLDAFARLFAWKLSLSNIRADASGLKIKGRVLHAINGHRDVNQTACPGRYLYAKLPAIRVAAEKIQQAAQGPTYNPLQTPAPAVAQPATLAFPARSNLAGNGWPALVLQDPAGHLSVLRTGGMVGYRPAVISPGPWARMDRIVAVGDLNGDHFGDVMARRKGTDGWRIYRGDGTGHVASTSRNQRLRLVGVSRVFPAGDWNHDGKVDVLGVDRKTKVLSLYPGTGRGSFGRPIPLASGWNRFPITTVAGDLTGDRRRDLVMLGTDHRVYIAARTRTGGLGKPTVRRYLGSSFNALTAGTDLTGDGIGDIALRRTDGSMIILPGNGHGGFSHALGPFEVARGLSLLTGFQMAGSGRADLVGRNSAGRLVVLINNGYTNLGALTSSALTTQPTTAVYDVGDWNGDGIPDIITRQRSGDRLVLNRGLGGGRFAKGIIMANGWQKVTQLAPVGDVTGDGHPDLVGRVGNGPMVIFPGDGSKGFLPPILAPYSLRTYNQIGVLTWAPGGGSASLVPSSDGSFVPFAGPGGNANVAMRQTGLGTLSGFDWVIGPGDVNGDGIADLLARRTSDGSLWLIPGTTTGFARPMYVGSGLGKYRYAG